MWSRGYARMMRYGFVLTMTSLVLAPAPQAGADGKKKRPPQPNSVGNAEGSIKGANKPRVVRSAQPAATRAARAAVGQVASPAAVKAKEASDLVFGKPIHYQNLSIVPVGTTRKGPFKRYTLMEVGLRDKTLEVRELKGNSGEARVSAVEVRNSGNQPVYLLGGEMILGGKQDRIIQQDTVVSNSRKWNKVSVFCVEQGRWRGQNMKFSAGRAVAHLKLQKAVMKGGQSDVWAEVARKNLERGTQNSTSTYRRTIQNNKVRRKIAPYRKKLTSMLPADIKLAGVVFAINGKIQVADLFGNPLLFGQLKNKLMTAYILEALGHQVVPNAPAVSVRGARHFLRRASKAKKVRIQGKASGRAINYKRKGKGFVGTEAYDPATGETLRQSVHAD